MGSGASKPPPPKKKKKNKGNGTKKPSEPEEEEEYEEIVNPNKNDPFGSVRNWRQAAAGPAEAPPMAFPTQRDDAPASTPSSAAPVDGGEAGPQRVPEQPAPSTAASDARSAANFVRAVIGVNSDSCEVNVKIQFVSKPSS